MSKAPERTAPGSADFSMPKHTVRMIRLPWFSYYDADRQDLAATDELQNIKPVSHFLSPDDDEPPGWDVQPGDAAKASAGLRRLLVSWTAIDLLRRPHNGALRGGHDAHRHRVLHAGRLPASR